jgi:hypothetical protein
VPPAAPAVTDRFVLIIEALCHAVARRIGIASLGGLAGPLIILIAARLRRMAARFTRLATSTQAGLEAPRPARLRQRAWAPLYPPRRFAWLLRVVPETAPIAAQLRHLLTEPEMTALLAATPKLRQTLRPLCQMLGIRQTPRIRETPSLAVPSVTPRHVTRRRAACGNTASNQPPPIPPPHRLSPHRLSPKRA